MSRFIVLAAVVAVVAPSLGHAAPAAPALPPPPLDSVAATAVPDAMPDAAGRPNADDRRARLMAMDTDHDGSFSKAEWLAAGRKERGFDFLDTDHDGKVTIAELRAGRAAMQARRDAKQ